MYLGIRLLAGLVLAALVHWHGDMGMDPCPVLLEPVLASLVEAFAKSLSGFSK